MSQVQSAPEPKQSSRYSSPLGLRIDHLWLSVPVLLVIWSTFVRTLPLLDFWTYLKLGEVIVQSGSLPRVDEFSFTAAGTPMPPHAWLAEVIYYLTFRAGGLPLQVALNTALLVAALLPVYGLCRDAAGQRSRVAVLAALVPGAVLAAYGSPRPQVFSFPFLAFFYAVLVRYRDGRRDWLWTLPALMVLWVNLHGAFILGLGLIGLFLVCEALRRFFVGWVESSRPTNAAVGLEDSTHPTKKASSVRTLPPRALGKLALVLALTGAATLVNPDGLGIYGLVRAIQQSQSIQGLVLEWLPPRIDDWGGILTFYGPFFLTLTALLASRVRLGLTDLVLFVGSAAFAMKAGRNGIWFALLSAPLLCRAVASLMAAWPGLESSEAPAGKEPGFPMTPAPATQKSFLNWSLACVLLGLTVILSPWVRPHLQPPGRPGLLAAATPVGAMNFLEEHHLPGHIFHAQIYGDYLIWRLWPEQRSFIDCRTHLFSDAVLNDYRTAFVDPQWPERLARYQIRLLLLDKADETSQRMLDDARASPEWRRLYEDDSAILFERQGDG